MQNKNNSLVTANQYPQRTNYFSRTSRMILSFGPHLGLLRSSRRPKGISIFIRVKDEADWIIPCIESIKKIADEIIVIDNGSSDGTFEKLEEAVLRERGLIRLWRQPELNHCELSNFALQQTSFKWVFRWDGDMIAHTSGDFDIMNLRKRILSLNPRRYYLIYLRHINLSGDLSHQNPNEHVHIEEYIHTYSDNARYVHPGRFEAIKVPKHYRILFWYEPYSFHVNVKPARKMLLRYFWEEWMESKDFLKYPALENFVYAKIEREFGTKSWEEAEKICVKKVLSNHVPYDAQAFGPYPDMLKPFLQNPKYIIAYKGSKIIGREEH